MDCEIIPTVSSNNIFVVEDFANDVLDLLMDIEEGESTAESSVSLKPLSENSDLSENATSPSHKRKLDDDSSGSLVLTTTSASANTLSTCMALTTTSSTGVYKRRRFRKPRPRVSPFPRILKRDIRRDYSTMYINVINSADSGLVTSFLETFCVDKCRMVDYYKPEENLPGKVPVLELTKLADITKRMQLQLSAAPDCVIRLQDAHIWQHLYEMGSKVVMYIRLQCTALAETMMEFEDLQGVRHEMPSFVYQAMVREGKIPPESLSTVRRASPKSSSILSPIQPSVLGHYNHTARSVTPYVMDIMGKITLSLDDENRIYGMEFEGMLGKC
eukprot:scaffold2421_cov171-Ochromonas_danica.AAC.1